MTPETPQVAAMLEQLMVAAMESAIGDARTDPCTAASDILEHLDSLALIRWPWEASCRDLHRYRDSPGGLMCMRRRGHDGKHRQGDVEWRANR